MLAALRLLWRLLHRAPQLPAAMKPAEKILTRGNHALLYGLLFAMPLTGWMMSSAKNYSVSWFGRFTWPDLIGKNEQWFEILKSTHHLLGWLLLGTAILHIVAALKHHFWDKDDVLTRMLPQPRTEKRT